jgi:hypothetical protein
VSEEAAYWKVEKPIEMLKRRSCSVMLGGRIDERGMRDERRASATPSPRGNPLLFYILLRRRPTFIRYNPEI